MEGSSAGCDLMNDEDLTQEFSEENFSLMFRDHSCDIVVKNVVVAALCLCLRRLPEAIVKRLGLIPSAEKNLKIA